MSRILKTYAALFRHWRAMAAGASYWHVCQGIGTEFVPGQLAGYFNDLIGKTHWTGPVSALGLPLVRIDGQQVEFPTTIFQKALGHWDVWIKSQRTDEGHWAAFRAIVDWSLSVQDRAGGWALPILPASSPYSAIAQGQAASILCRAYSVFHSSDYISAAERAIELMLRPLAEGGTARKLDGGFTLEEIPFHPASTILNGWIFGIYGLYDFQLVRPDSAIDSELEKTLWTLVHQLHRYDAGFWSFYDCSGTIASPFYHALHIAQLRALALTFPQGAEGFGRFAQRFTGYQRSNISRVRAVMMKASQKLLHPPAAVVE